MRCNVVTIICCIVLLSCCVSSLDNYHQLNTDLSFSITSNNATTCYLTTINSPTAIIFINQSGTQTSQTFDYTISAGNYTEKGLYCHNIECNDGVSFNTGDECYQVNYIGNELTPAQSTVYIGLLAILILILIGTFIGIGYLPSKNEQNPEGKIMSITYLKYFRLPLWMFVYFFAIGIVYLTSGIARGFLFETGFAQLLWVIFIIMMSLSPLVVILLFVWFFIEFFHDKEFQRYLNRGIFPGSDL